MWIDKGHYTLMNQLVTSSQDRNTDMLRREGGLRAKVFELQSQITKLEAERHWFMHRLTQVEQERGQLIQAAMGIKVSVPSFVPARDNVEDMLNMQPDFSTVGSDANEAVDPLADEHSDGVDYASMPGYKK